MSAFSPDFLAAMTLFAFVSSITPGPNNTMLLASGANFGLRRTVPHMLGVALGFVFLLLCVGLGLGALFAAFPLLQLVLKVAGSIYLLWLASKIVTARRLGGGAAEAPARPLTFLQAAAFQWVNPKAWTMALGALTAFAPKGSHIVGPVVVAGVFGLTNFPCIAAWAGCGAALGRFLERPTVLRAFNVGMGLLLAASLYPVLRDLWELAR